MKKEVEVIMAPGWVRLGVAMTAFAKGDPVFLEPSTGNIANSLPRVVGQSKILICEECGEDISDQETLINIYGDEICIVCHQEDYE